MVYCGKASQGCQSCRTRRIKCDKVRPQCTQCIRVAKACPGYRDQLELMFRDESTKVIKKAHAQWGVAESFESGESSSASPTSAASPGNISVRSRASITRASRSKSTTSTGDDKRNLITTPKEIYATRSDQAVRFFIEHYLVGHPDEPKASQELQGIGWIHAPQIQNIMAAVGLASMSNLTGDKSLQVMATEKYGLALRQMVESIKNLGSIDLGVSMRTIIILSLFEVCGGSSAGSASGARTHLMGAAALLRTNLARSGAASASLTILRALLQLCFSMVCLRAMLCRLTCLSRTQLIPCLVAQSELPDIFFDWVTMSENIASAPDKPSTDLIRILARLVHLSAFVNGHVLVDGHPKTTEVILEALEVDAQLEAWECNQEGIWVVTEEWDRNLPPDAVFDGYYHVYTDMWTARVWNHYRWSRLLVNDMLARFVESCPISSGSVVSASQQLHSRDCIIRVARDMLVSIPTHYRHPRLEPSHRKLLDKTSGGAGMGAAGIPTLLFQIRVAGCAPFVPARYRTWVRSILETIWANTGMTQAKTQAELVAKTQGEGSPEPQIQVKPDPDEKVKTPSRSPSSYPRYVPQESTRTQAQNNPHNYLGVELPGG
ncbi:white-opaque regulator 1 [Naviculisporaceae sp. PSN 640]